MTLNIECVWIPFVFAFPQPPHAREKGNETNEAGVIMMTVIAIIVRSIMSSLGFFSCPFGSFSFSWWNLLKQICFDFLIMMSLGDMFAVTCCLICLIFSFRGFS